MRENLAFSVTIFALGSAPMYEFLKNNRSVGLVPAPSTNDRVTIARNASMVSINSALEVDLQGQITVDTLDAREYSDVGGHMDSVEGRSLSRGHTALFRL